MSAWLRRSQAAAARAQSVQPTLSPGIVTPEETLARFVTDHHFDHDAGIPKPSLFSHAGSIGMSITRIERAGAEKLADQQNRAKYLGYVTVSCKAVRALLWESERMFAVYDTALPDNTAHADVCQAAFRSKSRNSEMRRNLQTIFTRSLTQTGG